MISKHFEGYEAMKYDVTTLFEHYDVLNLQKRKWFYIIFKSIKMKKISL
jgi:hypothetical protein